MSSRFHVQNQPTKISLASIPVIFCENYISLYGTMSHINSDAVDIMAMATKKLKTDRRENRGTKQQQGWCQYFEKELSADIKRNLICRC